MTDRNLGTELDRLGVTLDIEDDAEIEHALLVVTVRSPGAGRQIAMAVDNKQDWLDQLALVTAARDTLRGDL